MLSPVSGMLFSTAQRFYFIFLWVMWAVPFWPRQLWWLADLFILAPLWVLFFPLIFLFVSAILLKSRRDILLSIGSAAIIFFGIMGFNIPLPSFSAPPVSSAFSIKMITVNMGNVKDTTAFLKIISTENPDLITFQELYPQIEEQIKPVLKAGGWDLQSREYLGLASRFKIRSVEFINRRPFGGWAGIAAKYELETPVGIIYVFSVHMETLREGIEAFLERSMNAIARMKRVADQQEQESVVAASFAYPFSPLIVAGDFNMPGSSPVFKAHWAKYKDSFLEKGYGWGSTWHSSWHKVRIDHVLHDTNWKALESRVGAETGGDHYPLITRLVFTGKVAAIPELEKEDVPLETSSVKKTPSNVPSSQKFDGMVLNEWSLEAFPMVSFLYKIPPGDSVTVRVKTAWGDWLCLGGTASGQCQFQAVVDKVQLIDDNMWHKVKIDVRLAVQGVLPGVKTLTEFRFVDPAKDRPDGGFMIDQLKIFTAP